MIILHTLEVSSKVPTMYHMFKLCLKLCIAENVVDQYRRHGS